MGQPLGQPHKKLNIIFCAWGNFGATKQRNREGEGKQKGNEFFRSLCIQSPYITRLYLIS